MMRFEFKEQSVKTNSTQGILSKTQSSNSTISPPFMITYHYFCSPYFILCRMHISTPSFHTDLIRPKPCNLHFFVAKISFSNLCLRNGIFVDRNQSTKFQKLNKLCVKCFWLNVKKKNLKGKKKN